MVSSRLALSLLLSATASALGTADGSHETKSLRSSAGSGATAASAADLARLWGLFSSWAAEHGRTYADPDEEVERMRIWSENHEFIESHNGQVPEPSYTLGHNQFSDLTNDEFKRMHSLGEYGTPVDTTARDEKYARTNLILGDGAVAVAADDTDTDTDDDNYDGRIGKSPHSVDWAKKGAVTPVKNQGSCGACWAFSAIGAIEGAHFVKTGELVSLSEQELLDCDIHDKGCNGGLMDIAFEFDEKGRGICTEEDYPYVAKKHNTCDKDCDPVADTVVAKFTDVTPGDYNALKASIALQPTSIAIEAKQMVFQFYKSGVLDKDECGKDANIDHGVLAVGYGKDKKTGLTYWLVKNSWGETWGDGGYVKLARKSENRYGMCAILRLPSRPEVA